jgi:peptide/nickel transport system substrate-binding protein
MVEVATALKAGEDGDFQLYENTWSGRIDPDGNSVVYQMCGAPQNMGHYCDKEVDALHAEARAMTDPAKRKAIYEKMTEKFLANGWIIYLYHPQYLIAHTKRLEGFKPRPDGLIRVVGVRLK